MRLRTENRNRCMVRLLSAQEKRAFAVSVLNCNAIASKAKDDSHP